MLPRLSSLGRVLAAVFTACTLLAVPLTPAQARVFVGYGFGFGYPFYAPFYGPRFVYAPPVLYAATPVVYAVPPTYATAPAGRCFAAAYVCPVDRPRPVGAPCSCPTNTGRASGHIG